MNYFTQLFLLLRISCCYVVDRIAHPSCAKRNMLNLVDADTFVLLFQPFIVILPFFEGLVKKFEKSLSCPDLDERINTT